MKLPIIAIVALAIALPGCARLQNSRLNPMNWFGRAQQEQGMPIYTAPTDRRALVGQVTLLKVEPYPGGAIVRATGLPPTQGYWEAELVALPVDEAGKLVYEFRVFAPLVPAPAGSPYSRQITAAAAISDIRLEGVRTIVVQGASNAMSVRR